MPTDYRFDPFTNTKQPVVITSEKWTIPTSSPFTIRLIEVPLKETPSSLSMRVVDFMVAAITTAAQNNIVVQNSTWFPSNAVITIDSEKLQVVGPYSSAATTLSTAITSTTATTFSAASGAALAVGEIVQIDSEYMLITAISTNTVTATRGYNGSTAATHASGAGILVQNSLAVTRGYNGTTATTHTAGTDVFIENSMSEVSAIPIAGQFWPDYSTKADGDSDWNTGTILFNSLDAGKKVAVSYKGMGSLADYRAVAHGQQLFTANGIFVVPAGITTVWITGCGAGGKGGDGGTDGSTDYAGGGGGGAKCTIAQKITGLTPGSSIPVTVGTTPAAASSFGAYVTLTGGGNGGVGAGVPGTPGISGGFGGQAGGVFQEIFLSVSTGIYRNAFSGDSLFGTCDKKLQANATGYGAGGCGGYGTSTIKPGGNPSYGFILVEW